MNGEWRFRIAIKTVKPAALRAAIRERILPAAHATRETRLAINVTRRTARRFHRERPAA